MTDNKHSQRLALQISCQYRFGLALRPTARDARPEGPTRHDLPGKTCLVDKIEERILELYPLNFDFVGRLT